MNGAGITLAVTWVLVAVLLVIQPWFARRNVLFGVVFGDDEVWKDPRARSLRMRYLRVMTAGTAAVSLLVLAWCLAARMSVAAAMVPYLVGTGGLLAYGTVVFVVFHARTVELKAARGVDEGLVSDQIRVETALSDRRTVVPAAWLLLLIPVQLAQYVVAVWGYPAMPARLPIHYSFAVVDAWASKSWPMVLFPLLTGTAVTVLMLVCCLFTRRAPASVRGNPDAAPGAYRFRRYMIALLIVLGILTQITFLLVEIGFLTPISPLLFEVPVVLDLGVTAAIFAVYFRFVRVKKPKGPILNDDAKWVWGMFYYNPSDPSTFVEKRTGIGYTLNFARPAGWILLLGILLFVVLTAVFSVRA